MKVEVDVLGSPSLIVLEYGLGGLVLKYGLSGRKATFGEDRMSWTSWAPRHPIVLKYGLSGRNGHLKKKKTAKLKTPGKAFSAATTACVVDVDYGCVCSCTAPP